MEDMNSQNHQKYTYIIMIDIMFLALLKNLFHSMISSKLHMYSLYKCISSGMKARIYIQKYAYVG